MHMWTALRYPAADSGSSDIASDTHEDIVSEDLVSTFLTIDEKSFLDSGGPSEATILTAASQDPPDSSDDVIIPTTVGHSFSSLLLSVPLRAFFISGTPSF
jgi:hypothetical protein